MPKNKSISPRRVSSEPNFHINRGYESSVSTLRGKLPAHNQRQSVSEYTPTAPGSPRRKLGIVHCEIPEEILEIQSNAQKCTIDKKTSGDTEANQKQNRALAVTDNAELFPRRVSFDTHSFQDRKITHPPPVPTLSEARSNHVLKIPSDSTTEITKSEIRRNESQNSFKPVRKLSIFQKAVNTIATIQVDSVSVREGSILENFIPKKLPQILATVAATIGAFATGTVLAWSSPALDQLHRNEGGLIATPSELSWIASTVPLAAALAGPPTGKCIQLIGRKPMMIALSVPFTIGWLLTAFAGHVYLVIAGRFLTGYCTGAVSVTVPIFVSETVEDSIRGTLGSSFQLMMNFGILFTTVMGALVTWRHLALINAAVPMLMCVIMLYVPASPRYLLSRGKRVEAERALMWFRGAVSVDQIRSELETIQNSLEEDDGQSPVPWSYYTSPELVKPMCISIGLMLTQVLSGSDAVTFYTVEIFEEAGGLIDKNLAAIVVNGVQALATIPALILVDRAGRKPLLLISVLVSGLTVAALGGYFMLDVRHQERVALLPLVSMIGFVTAFSLGLGPIPWMMMGEILPYRIIGSASAVATSFNWISTFFVIRFFPHAKDAIGPHWSFISFAIFCTAGLLFIFLLVPETKGKSLEEIQQLFSKSEKGITTVPTRKISRSNVDSYFFA